MMVQKPLIRRVANRILASLARICPGATTLRPFLHKLRGVKISGRVFIGDDVYLENEYPECIELQDGAQICLRSIILAHTRGQGRVVIGRDVFVATNSVILASPGRTLTVGEGSVVTASSVITVDVPPRTLVGCEKARPLARLENPLTIDTSYESFLAGLRPLQIARPSAGSTRAQAAVAANGASEASRTGGARQNGSSEG